MSPLKPQLVEIRTQCLVVYDCEAPIINPGAFLQLPVGLMHKKCLYLRSDFDLNHRSDSLVYCTHCFTEVIPFPNVQFHLDV